MPSLERRLRSEHWVKPLRQERANELLPELMQSTVLLSVLDLFPLDVMVGGFGVVLDRLRVVLALPLKFVT